MSNVAANAVLVTGTLTVNNTTNTINLNVGALLNVNGAASFTNTISGVQASFSNSVTVLGPVTVNSTVSSGNLAVNGTITATQNSSITGTLFVGGLFTVNSTANVAQDLIVGRNLYITGNSTVTGTNLANGNIIPVLANTYSVGAAGNTFIVFASKVTADGPVVVANTTQMSSFSYNFTTTAAQILDTFSIATYRSGEYTLQLVDSTNSRYQISKVNLIHDGTVAYSSEYGIINNGTSMGVVTANTSGGNVNLIYTPIANTTVAKVIRNLIMV